ncbi:MAG: hypothetical protein WCP21_11305 [Armatimonadota bacterium]
MLFLVTAEARDSIVGAEVPRLRAGVETAVKRISASGRMQAGGILGARRAAFFLLEIDSAEELLTLLGGEIIDNMQVESSPVVSFEDIGKFFAKHPPQ